MVPFIKELKTWLRAYKSRPKPEEKKSMASIPVQMKTSETIKLPDLEKMKSNERKEEENYNDFKKFMMKPSLPKFEILIDENEKRGNSDEKKPELKKEEKKEAPQKKEQKIKILKNTEKNNENQSRINIFEKKLSEITNNTIKLLSTQNVKAMEANPFRQFKLDTSELAVFC